MDQTTKNSQTQEQPPRADVLLITVTDVETRTVLAAAEKKVGHKCKSLYIGHRTYYDLGAIGKARTFLVRSEMGSGGSGGSQSTVQAGINVLSPSAVIMVGIAFGVDSKSQQIGDILISHQLQAYDLQKVTTDSDGELCIVPRGERVGASPRLLDRFRDGALFWKGAKTWFGLVLSGQKLIDNKQFRDELIRHWPEAIGGEMEGAGVYAAANISKVDWILVKAICDWADRKGENKEQRQEEAARNAADFTIHVIQRGGFSEDKPDSAEQANSTMSLSIEVGRTLQQNNDVTVPSQQFRRDNNVY